MFENVDGGTTYDRPRTTDGRRSDWYTISSTGGFQGGGGAHPARATPKIAKAKFFDMIFSSRYCF